MRTALITFALGFLAILALTSPARRDSTEFDDSPNIQTRGEDEVMSSHSVLSLDPRDSDLVNRKVFVSPSVDGGNATGDQIGPSAFQIPDTDTKLYFSATGTTQSRLLKNLLNATLKFIRDQLAASGDGELPKHLDPFTYDLEQGIFFQASSQEGRHLTWSLLNSTLSWLDVHLSGYLRYRSLCTFRIYDGPDGLSMGRGSFALGFSGVPIPQLVQGAEGVTN